MGDGDPTLQEVAAQQQRHDERLSILETQMKDLKTQVRSVEETLNSQFSFLCKHLVISVPVVPSTNFTPDPDSTYAAQSKPKETKPIASVDEEATNSIDLELIPSFFFSENDNVDLLHRVRLQFEENSKLEINGFFELSPVTIDIMKDVKTQVCVQTFEENFDISGNLMEFFFLPNKLLRMDCFGLHLDYSRSLFDRSKCTAISSLTYEKLFLQLLLSLGYDADLRFISSFPRFCFTDFAFLGGKKMFVHRLGRSKCLSLLFARVMTIEISRENLASSMDLIVIDSILSLRDCVTLLFDYTRSLFDRGKELEFGVMTSFFTKCSEIVSKIDVCLVLLGEYYRIFAPKLIPEHDYWPASWSLDVFSATWQILGKMFQIDIVFLKSNNVLNHPFSSEKSLYDGRVFDRGREFCIINGYSYFTGDHKFSFGLTDTAWVLFGTILESEAWCVCGGRDDFLLQLKIAKMSYKLIIDEGVLIIIHSARCIYNRGKVFNNTGYFSFAGTFKCCIVTYTSGVTMFLVPNWISYEQLTFRLLPNLGYASNFWVIHSMALVCVVDHTEIQDASQLFIELTDRDSFPKGT